MKFSRALTTTIATESWYLFTLGLLGLFTLELLFPTLIATHLPLPLVGTLWLLSGLILSRYATEGIQTHHKIILGFMVLWGTALCVLALI